MTKYPTVWQRKTMWAALTTFFVVLLITIGVPIIWIVAKVVGFLQPILIPVAIAVILAYLLDPLVTKMSAHGLSRTKAVFALFTIAFLSIGALVAWLAPVVSMQATNVGRELPAIHPEGARYDRRSHLQIRPHVRCARAQNGTRSRRRPTSLLNWLFAAPTPARKPTPTPRTAADATVARGRSQRRRYFRAVAREEIGPSRTESPPPTASASRHGCKSNCPISNGNCPTSAKRFGTLLKQSIGGFLGVTGFLLSLVMVPIYLFFLLKESPSIERRWREYLPLRNSPLKNEVAAVLTQINSYIIAYFRGQLLVCLINGILIGTALYMCGLNFAPLIGLLVVVLTMIPYIGIVLCWIPAVLIAAGAMGRLDASTSSSRAFLSWCKISRPFSSRRASSETRSGCIR